MYNSFIFCQKVLTIPRNLQSIKVIIFKAAMKILHLMQVIPCRCSNIPLGIHNKNQILKKKQSLSLFSAVSFNFSTTFDSFASKVVHYTPYLEWFTISNIEVAVFFLYFMAGHAEYINWWYLILHTNHLTILIINQYHTWQLILFSKHHFKFTHFPQTDQYKIYFKSHHRCG